MFIHVKLLVQSIEDLISQDASRDLVFKKLRRLSLSDFGEFLISLPNPEFPRLSEFLPRMVSNEVQIAWTGASGITLLTQTIDFVRSMSYNFTKITGSTLEGKKILDYGCGYGRISRMMYYFTDESNLFALDPWDVSIHLCHSHGLEKNFTISEYLPKDLPFEEKFDLIFAFSVFTHLSQMATTTNLNILSSYVKPGGLIVITIRPVEYWDIDKYANERGLVNRLKSDHANNGFAFLPHNRPPIDGDITYGDTSMSLQWIEDNFKNLEIAGIDRSLSDTYQIYVFMKIRY
jgi:SAM-dependent methyltransferase